MRLIFTAVILGFVLITGINYVSYYQTGYFPAHNWWAHSKAFYAKIMGSHYFKGTAPAVDTAPIMISKWTDSKGIVHYENRHVKGAKIIEVDPDINVLPPAPVVESTEAKTEQPKTTDDELRDLQEAKRAHLDALTN